MAQFQIGQMYYIGRGVPQDDAETLKWYRRAAEQGFLPAQVFVGVMYGAGEGGPRELVLSHMWFDIVASQLPPGEHRDSIIFTRDMAAKAMTPAQITEAQRLAREWKPKKQ